MKQHIWLIRYGKTECPLVEFEGPYDSDIDPKEGIAHGESIATAIASAYSPTLPTKVYSSPFLRCVHTSSILASKLNTNIQIEEGLYEWLAPSLCIDQDGTRTYPHTASELRAQFGNIDHTYRNLNPYNTDESNERFSFPEDEMKLLRRCRDTLDMILKDANGENIAIVAHAPCLQALAFAMEEGVHTVHESKLGPLPIGAISRFSREVEMEVELALKVRDDATDHDVKHEKYYSEWAMDFYGSSEHMPGDYKAGAGKWSLPCFRTSPIPKLL